MALEPGSTLSQYEILAPLGAGGMGEVYRARDPKLEREVAIKVLPEDFATDPERLARFEREAKALAALNHPNVATVHGFERDGDVHFLVMELVEGEELAERIRRGPIPVEEAVPLFVQIAEGLEAAHEKGIVHRDLKPANIKVTADGRAKVLDFGLAKAMGGAFEGDADLSHSPTMTAAAATRRGEIMGTAAYMSPEQARGRPVDARTDIWAFGATFFEALTGRFAFAGDTSIDVLSAVVSREPDWESLSSETPRPLRRLLRRCLVKEPRQRLQSIGDARVELEDLGAGRFDEGPVPPAEAGSSVRKWRVLCAILALATLAALASHFVESRSGAPEAERLVRRFTIRGPDEAPVAPTLTHLLGVNRNALALSPDAKYLVYTTPHENSTRLMLRPLDRFEATPIEGTEGAFSPFFSPDGQWLGFFTESTLKKVPLRGGGGVTLCEVRNPVDAIWAPDGRIIFADREGGVLAHVSESGGVAEAIVEVRSEDDELNLVSPQLLPDGEHLLLSAVGVVDRRVIVVSLKTGRRTVLDGPTGTARYLASGHLVFGGEAGLYALPFDSDTLEIGTSPIPVIGGIWRDDEGMQLAIAQDGTVAYLPGEDMDVGSLVWRGRDGVENPLSMEPGRFGQARQSPDGRRVAVEIQRTNRSEIRVYDGERGTSDSLNREGDSCCPVWAPDGSGVAYWHRSGSAPGAEGGSSAVLMYESVSGGAASELSGQPLRPSAWLGEWLVVERWSSDSMIWALSTSAPDALVPAIEATDANEWGAALSPDGKYIAYTSDESGAYQVYVQPFPPTGEQWRVSTQEGSEEPVWSPQGGELVFRSGQTWWSVPVSTEGLGFEYGDPEFLFRGAYVNVSGRSYDISADGERFLLIKAREEPPRNEIRIILNFFEELERLVPTD